MANDSNSLTPPRQANLNGPGDHQQIMCDISDFYWSNHEISETVFPSPDQPARGTVFPESQYAEFIDSRDEERDEYYDPRDIKWPESMSFLEAERRLQRGQHRGKGPRAYQRSDERIQEDINDRLCEDSFIDATDIEVQVNHGEIILTGLVEDVTAKWRAEHIASGVAGVKTLENHLRTKVV